jgi:hypothetical protein
MRLERVQTLISGLQLPNFIFNCVKFFAELPAFDCKICLVENNSNWLAGSLSGQKSPIFHHTSQFFLTIALLWPAKNRFVWQKMYPFLAQTRPANQLQIKFFQFRLRIKI